MQYQPQLCKPYPEPFDDTDWVFEPKYDGFRMLAYLGAKPTLLSRTNHDVTDSFPEIRPQLSGCKSAVLDGEIVAYNDKGRPDFQLVQTRTTRKHLTDQLQSVFYIVFDILEVDKQPLIGLPLEHRDELLKRYLPHQERIVKIARMSSGIECYDFFATKHGWEGIVAKRLNSLYLPGKRNDCWRKIKATRVDTFYVVGLTQGFGKRTKTFGAMVLALKSDNQLVGVGEVGTGWDDDEQADLLELCSLFKVSTPPLAATPTAMLMWCEPKIRVQVQYLELSNDGQLRHPSFKGVEGVD